MAEELIRMGFAVDIVLLRANGPLTRTLPREVQVVDLNATRIRSALPGLRRYFQVNRPLAAYANIWPLTLATTIIAKTAGVRSQVVTMHQNSLTDQYVDARRHSRMTMRAALKLELALAPRVVGCSIGVI